MSSFFFGLILLFAAILGIIATLIFTLIAISRRTSKSWAWSGYSFFMSSSIVIMLILIHELILFPPNPKTDQLVLTAYREAPIGGVWLGLYDDQIWQLGYSSVEITSAGKYQITGDTLTLYADEGTTIIGEVERTSFIIKSKSLVEIKNSGIRFLEIELNKVELEKL